MASSFFNAEIFEMSTKGNQTFADLVQILDYGQTLISISSKVSDELIILPSSLVDNKQVFDRLLQDDRVMFENYLEPVIVGQLAFVQPLELSLPTL